ncbi:MAG: hypothetical protein IIW11_03035 [Bacteroidales bacterium]|nr:hypothetical protein [Bacteroidales bacterium]
MKKTMQFMSYIVAGITIIGAISTADAVFVAAGIISIFPLAKEIKRFIDENSGPIDINNQ